MADMMRRPEVKRMMTGVALLACPIRKSGCDAVAKVSSRQPSAEVDGLEF